MTFIVILIALLVERFFDWTHLRNWAWFIKFQTLIINQFPKWSPPLLLLAALLPILIVILIVNYLLIGVLYGFISLLLNLSILIFCFGPQNLWADAFGSIQRLAENDIQIGHDKLQSTFGIEEASSLNIMHEQFLDRLFIEGNRRIFSVVFWYLVAGMAGALIYRAVTIAHRAGNPQVSLVNHIAGVVESVLEWLPVRIFTFLFALGGHFVQVLSEWQRYCLKGPQLNNKMLIECGHAALGLTEIAALEFGTSEKQALSLLDRVFIITLVLIALGSFIF